jgi:hypothetical protein
MNPNNQALKVALAAVEQLPSKLQKQLAERLISSTISDKNLIAVYLRRLPSQKQTRLAELMDKNNEGRLTRSEKLELKQLGFEIDKMLLANSHAIARALRPELFGKQGQPIKSRFRQEINEPVFKHSGPKHGNGRR